MTPPRDQIKDSVGGSAGSPRVASSAGLPETCGGGLSPSTQTNNPAPETILQAMASGRAYIGEDHWSHLRAGTVSDRLCNFFNNASYMSNALVICIILYFSSPLSLLSYAVDLLQMVAEMSGACQAGEAQAERIKRLEAQLKESENRCARVELAH